MREHWNFCTSLISLPKEGYTDSTVSAAKIHQMGSKRAVRGENKQSRLMDVAGEFTFPSAKESRTGTS